MQSRSLLLDTGTWDIVLDDTGNLAITDNPHAVAQDVACACSTFLGECCVLQIPITTFLRYCYE